MEQSAERWLRTERAFHAAAAVGEPERSLILEARCEGDATLMAELRSLLCACEAEEQHRGSLAANPWQESRQHTRIGPWELDRLLGRGDMGAVYLASRRDGQYDQQVAIKLIDMPVGGEFFRERFRQERQILALLAHPFIARLLDGGVSEDGELYLAMEYVEGITLTRYCEDNQLSLHARLELFLKVCDAVQYAHQNLVIHRDLKPDNILIAADGTPRLLDFGTAKLLAATPGEAAAGLTQSGLQAYTPQYASPEQVMGEPITIASDTYSLGVLLYLLVAGVPPYRLQEGTMGEMLRLICEEVPVAPSRAQLATADGACDGDLDAVILKALRKEPRERYGTVDQFAADLRNYRNGLPVAARAGTLRYRAGKFVRRNKLALAAACVLCVSLLAGAGGVLWQSRIANEQRRRAEARSADLRELSDSLLSELDEALKEIPGSTGAQHLLVTRVLEHLDRMAGDAHGDRDTELELVQAYTRLGNNQGNVYDQNLADTAGAVHSFDKALALAGPLAAANPRDRDALRALAAALEARGEAVSQAGDAQASAADLRQAVAVYDRVVELPGATPATIFEAAVAYETLGNELSEDSGLADPAAGLLAYRRAMQMDERALRLDPAFMPVLRGLPTMHLHLAVVVMETDPVQAMAELTQALALAEKLPAEQKEKRAQVRLRATLHRKLGDAYAELGQYGLAAEQFAVARPVIQRLVDADSKDVNALADLQRLENDEAACAEYGADLRLASSSAARKTALREAETALQARAATIRQIMGRSPSDASWQEPLALLRIELGAVRFALSEPAQDAGEAASALATLRRAVERPQAAASDIDAAVRAELMVQPAALRERSLAVQWAQRGVEMTHHREAAYLLLLAEADHAGHQDADGIAAAREGLSLLPQAAPGAPPSRLRRVLEYEANSR